MSDENKLIEDPELVKNKIEYENQMKQIREQVVKRFAEYRVTLDHLAADAPISVLCLPPVIENALRAHGCLRVYHLLDCDFTKIKGLGVRRIGDLTTCLDKFLSML